MPIDYLNDAGAGDFNQQRNQRTQDLDRQLGYDMAGFSRDAGSPRWGAEVQQRQVRYLKDRGDLDAWLNRGAENGTLDQNYAGSKQRAYSDQEKARQVAKSQQGLQLDYLDPSWRPPGRQLAGGMGYSNLPDDAKSPAAQPDWRGIQRSRDDAIAAAQREQGERERTDRLQHLEGLNTISGAYQSRSGPTRGATVPFNYSVPLTESMRAYA